MAYGLWRMARGRFILAIRHEPLPDKQKNAG